MILVLLKELTVGVAILEDAIPKIEHHLVHKHIQVDLLVRRPSEEVTKLLVFRTRCLEDLLVNHFKEIPPAVMRRGVNFNLPLLFGMILNRHIVPIPATLERAVHREQRLIARVHRCTNVEVVR